MTAPAAPSPRPFDAFSYLEWNAARRPDALAVLDEGREIPFSELLGATKGFMADLVARGVQRGQVVAIALANVWSYVSLEIAVPAVGAVLLPVPIQLGHREITSELERAGASLLISDTSELGSAILEVGRSVPSVRATVPVDELTWRHHGDPGLPSALGGAEPSRIVQIAPTSGTTGLPNLASLSAELKQLTFEGFTSRLGISETDRVLPMSPITQGVGEMSLYSLRTGAALVMAHEQRFDSERILALVEASRATVIVGVPTMIGRLLNSRALQGATLASLRATLSAGAPLSPTLAEAWERRTGSRTGSFYGAMDIGQLAVPDLEDPAEKRWTTVGRPHDRAEYSIHDASGQPAPAGVTGEICMRGPLVQQRYWEEEKGPFADDGWAHFGDVGFIDAEGYLHVTGRMKDTIIRGGNNINPTEIEEILRHCPGVLDACVVGAPDADLGEVAVAFVVCSDGAPPTLAELHGFLGREGLTRLKWPEAIKVMKALPVRATGKVDRSALRREAATLHLPERVAKGSAAC